MPLPACDRRVDLGDGGVALYWFSPEKRGDGVAVRRALLTVDSDGAGLMLVGAVGGIRYRNVPDGDDALEAAAAIGRAWAHRGEVPA